MFTVSAAEARRAALTEKEPPPKRQRLETKPASTSQNSMPAAFHLLRTKGIAAEANECEAKPIRQNMLAPVACSRGRASTGFRRGMLGLRLRDVVSGPMRWVFISNYMVDLDWLLSAAPDLAEAERLMIAHGWRRPVRYDAPPSCAPACIAWNIRP